MTIKKYMYLCFLLSSVSIISCKPGKEKSSSTAYEKMDIVADNYQYPADSTTINNWISSNNFNAIHKHGWYIWQHITAPVENNKLRYQTWSSPQQILAKLNAPKKLNTVQSDVLFRKPSQFSHAKAKQATFFDDTNIVEVVAYNKAAEDYAIKNKIFYLSSLKKFEKEGMTSIPEFPEKAITIKPVYKIITQNKLTNGIYTMSAWNGPKYQAEGYPEKDWGSCIYVNTLENKSNPNGFIDATCSNRTNDNTFYLNDFIHFTITQTQADSYNSEISDSKYKATVGDIALLVGMHLTTKETKRWTWQTYWWSATPYNPYTPSSNEIASARQNIALYKAANHYAMASAYSMLAPVQPYTGGTKEGEPIIAFNPYLESGFGNSVFTGSASYVTHNGNTLKTDLGVLTNCMSCHIASAVNTTTQATPSYFGDTYISYKDTIFKNKIMLDFAWSVQANIDDSK